MVIRNVQIAGKQGSWNILIDKDRILSTIPYEEKNYTTDNTILFERAIAFPGLINSHEHIDFNLFPPLGKAPYANYRVWGNDIHKNNKAAIDAVLKIPLSLRVQWGIYKNLLSGVTTVVNHGQALEISNDLITIYQDSYSLHSAGFEKNWRWKLNSKIKKGHSVAMHMGEGIDSISYNEINSIIRWNLFKRKIVGIHGVAMKEEQARHFHGLVWCPVSNYFLLNKTASIDKLKHKTDIVFGTDSTLTADWNIWEHLRVARMTKMMSDDELFFSITSTAARVWNLQRKATLEENEPANIVVAETKKDLEGWDAFYSTDPENILLVIHNGKIRLFDDRLKDQLLNNEFDITGFSKITVAENIKYVYGDLPYLIKNIRGFYPEVFFPVSITEISEIIS